MSRSGLLHLLLAVVVCGLWAAAACSGGGENTGNSGIIQPGTQILDDDDYTRAPALPCDASMTPGTTCTVQGQVLTSVTLPSGASSIRVAFYSSSQLADDGQPSDPAAPSSSLTLPAPFDFPLPYQAHVATGTFFVGEAWLDSNGNGVQDGSDLIGYGEAFSPGVSAPPVITLEPWTE